MWIILGGIAAIVLGVLGLIEWWELFVKALAACVPFILLMCGILAIIIGISSIKEKMEERREEAAEKSSTDNES